MLRCRFCDAPLNQTFINLGMSPLSNAFLKPEQIYQKEAFYPLHVRVCEKCFLVQLPECESPEQIFSDYAYFSSYSDSWLSHSKRYVDMMIERFAMNPTWQVIEVASNDGYLLQYFKEKQIPVLGIEPAKNVARVAEEKGIPTLSEFFGTQAAEKLCREGRMAHLVIGNNVLAHVPNLNDFIAGLKIILAPQGIITIEVPHVMQLIQQNQFDTIYHEHFSYFSLLTLLQAFKKHQLAIFDVETLSQHGGSLRLFIKHVSDETYPVTDRVSAVLAQEKTFGLDRIETYEHFADTVFRLKYQLLGFILEQKQKNKKIVGYGAPAKGNTLLNYYGLSVDALPFTVDRSPHKQNHYLPGTRIPIYHPDKLQEEKPDYVLLLPWNLKEEIMSQIDYIRSWGGQFVVPIPSLQVI